MSGSGDRVELPEGPLTPSVLAGIVMLHQLGLLPRSRLIEAGTDGVLRCRLCGYAQEARC